MTYAAILIILVSAALALAILFTVRVGLAARRAKRAVAQRGIIGLKARAVTRLAPEGTVFVRNELWRARSAVSVSEGEKVLVMGLEGLTLKVEPLGQVMKQTDKTLATRERSN